MFNERKIERRLQLQAQVDSVVTEARVIKLLHKMVDDGVIPEDWGEKEMGIISKKIGGAVYYDCLKEEKETVEEVGASFGMFAQKTAMRIIRTVFADRL